MSKHSKIQLSIVLGLLAVSTSIFAHAEPMLSLFVTILSGFTIGYHIALSK